MEISVLESHLRQVLYNDSHVYQAYRAKAVHIEVDEKGMEKTIVLTGRVKSYYIKQMAQAAIRKYVEHHRNNGLAGAEVIIYNRLKVRLEE